MLPRPHQSAAIDAIEDYLSSEAGNPCAVIPTAGGKTPIMVWLAQRWCQAWPKTRILIVAHVKELLAQGVETMRRIWPQAPVGIYSAGLKRKEKGYAVTYASIQSIFRKGCDFDPFDVIMIDEAHRVSLARKGQYHQFITDCKLVNPNVRVIGFTATPYRLSGGTICHPDYILNEICYEAAVKPLIDDGYLCKLRTKLASHEIDTRKIKRVGADYNLGKLAEAASEDVAGIVGEAIQILDRESRKACIWFAVTKEHAEKIGQALSIIGQEAPCVHDGTPPAERANAIARFTAGHLRHIININVLSEGFDSPRIDACILVRPTLSKGLYYQQVGRGLRLHPDKADCLVLDFSGNVALHGPIDQLEGQAPQMRTCGECREHFPEPLGKCPACGWIIPPPPPSPPGEEKPAPGPRIIPSDPSARTEAPILSDSRPWEMAVKSVQVRKHEKAGKPSSLQVTYEGAGGLENHREWICLEHVGYARKKAESWWKSRFGEPVPASVDDAIRTNLFLAASIAAKTESITVRRVGRYTEIVGVKFKRQEMEAVAR